MRVTYRSRSTRRQRNTDREASAICVSERRVQKAVSFTSGINLCSALSKPTRMHVHAHAYGNAPDLCGAWLLTRRHVSCLTSAITKIAMSAKQNWFEKVVFFGQAAEESRHRQLPCVSFITASRERVVRTSVPAPQIPETVSRP